MRSFAVKVWQTVCRMLQAPSFVLGCLAGAFLLRLIWVLLVRTEPQSDFFWYYERGMVLATQGEYTWFGLPTAYFPPAYPLLLAGLFKVFGVSLFAAKVVSVLLQCGAVYLLYRVTRHLFASEFTARLAMLLYAAYPDNIGFSSLLASEHLFIFLMLLGIALLLVEKQRLWLLALCGIIWGLATLTRPQALFIPVIFYALVVLKEKNWRTVLLPCITVHLLLGLTLLPWFARNYHVFHRPLITTTTGVNLYIGNNPDANGTYIFTNRMLDAVPEPRWTELDFDDSCRKAAKAFMAKHPGHTLALLPLKIFWLYIGDFISMYWNIRGVPHASPLLLAALRIMRIPCQIYYLFLLAGFIMAVTVRKHRQAIHQHAGEFPRLGLGIIIYFTAVYLVYYGTARYHAPMMPWMIMYAAALLRGVSGTETASATMVDDYT